MLSLRNKKNYFRIISKTPTLSGAIVKVISEKVY